MGNVAGDSVRRAHMRVQAYYDHERLLLQNVQSHGIVDHTPTVDDLALLSARMHARVDDCVPEIAHDVLAHLFPHALRTIPATTVVQWSLRPGVTHDHCVVPRGTPLASGPVRGTRCLFETTDEITVLPLTIDHVRVDMRSPEQPVLHMHVRGKIGSLAALRDDRLRCWVQGTDSIASMLWLWCVQYSRAVSIAPLQPQGGVGSPVPLPSGAVRMGHVPLRDGENVASPLWPNAGWMPTGIRLLREAVHCQPALMSFDIHGIQRAAAWDCDGILISITLQAPPRLPGLVRPDMIKLHCVPAVNLFAASAEPVRWRGVFDTCAVRAAEMDPDHVEVSDVTQVIATRRGAAERHMIALSHINVRRVPHHDGQGIQTWLSVHDAWAMQHGKDPTQDIVLSMDLLCNQRTLARDIKMGEIRHGMPRTPSRITGVNVADVAAPVLPQLAAEWLWQMLACVQQGNGWRDVQHLRQLLGLCVQQIDPDGIRVPALHGAQRGVRQVIHRPMRWWMDGASVRGTQTTVEIDVDVFDGLGQAYLFAAVLANVWASTLQINQLHQLIVRCWPSGREWVFPVRGCGM